MTPPLHSKTALAAIALGFAQDEFFAADAAADAALDELATFAGRAKLWQNADVQVLAQLNELAFAAEERRRNARCKLVWEFCEAVRVSANEEEKS